MPVKKTRFNKMCDVWTLELARGVSQNDVMDVLEKDQLLESEWNVEAIRMEHVFMDLVEEAEACKSMTEK